jgi:hypothetical protein
MATQRQIEANRRNAARSTGPRTRQGKLRSRRNALRHGLTAEIVAESFEVAHEFEALEAALIADYDPQSTLEFQLVGRIASLLWRLRRASLIETGLFEIQGRAVCRQREHVSVPGNGDKIAKLYCLCATADVVQTPDCATEPGAGRVLVDTDLVDAPLVPCFCHTTADARASLAAAVYLRLCRYNEFAIERLTRYETALWRQLAQTLMMWEVAVRGRGRAQRRIGSRRAKLSMWQRPT